MRTWWCRLMHTGGFTETASYQQGEVTITRVVLRTCSCGRVLFRDRTQGTRR